MFLFYPSGAGYQIYFQEHASNETLDLESSVGLSNWRNLTLTRESGASSNFYIDGSLAKTFTFSTCTAPVDVALMDFGLVQIRIRLEEVGKLINPSRDGWMRSAFTIVH